MVRNLKALILMLICTMLMCTTSVMAASDTVDAVVTIQPGLAEVSTICKNANAEVGGKNILSYNSNDGSLTFDNSLYSTLESLDKRAFMETALATTRECRLGTKNKNKVYNFIAEQDSPVANAVKYLEGDVSADFVEAKAWFAPFSGPVSTVLGVLSLLIFLFMGASMLFDIAYLVLPGFQMVVERGEPDKRPFGVSNEAWKANREIADANNSSNCMSVYLKKRIPVILLIAICLGYLISGQIYSLLIWFIDAFNFN